MNSPYAPPRSVVADAPSPNSAAEAIRREHMRHEIQLKSIGSLYYLGAFFGLLGGLGFVMTLFGPNGISATTLGVTAVYLVIGVGSLFLGYGFRRLRPWVMIPATIFSCIGLLAIPVSTLINGWILYLIHSKKGRTVLGADYQQIVEATPHVKYERSVGDWIATGIVLLFLVGLLGMLAFSVMRMH